jgi:hypothetical protein
MALREIRTHKKSRAGNYWLCPGSGVAALR